MKTKFRKQWFTAAVIFAMLILVRPMSAQAANPTAVRLREGVTYQKYDITGDRKADKILIRSVYDSWGDGWGPVGIEISVNGKTACRFIHRDDGYHVAGSTYAALYTLKNGLPLLYISCGTDYDEDVLSMLLQYRAGKLNKIIDFDTAFVKYGMHADGRVVRVSGNSMVLGFSLVSWTLGVSQYNFAYTYRNGTMRMANNLGTVSISKIGGGSGRTVTVGRNLRVYTNVSARKTAFLLKRGNKVSVNRIYYGKAGVWLQIYYKGKIGYLKCLTSYPADGVQVFSDTVFAG